MYFCVACSVSIVSGLACTICIASATTTKLPVQHCNYCGDRQDQRGTECKRCETARIVRYYGTARPRRRTETDVRQATLW